MVPVEQVEAQGEQQNPPQNPSRLEWLVAGLGLVLVSATLGFLFYQVLFVTDTPPDISLRLLSVAPASGGYLVIVEAENRGGETAAELVVEGEIMQAGESLEASELTFDFVPPASSREGGLFFSRDPAGRLELRAKSYRKP